MTDDEPHEEHGLTHKELQWIIADLDPLPPEARGAPYSFAEQEYVPLFPLDDFTWVLSSPPPPDAKFDLQEAWAKFENDCRWLRYAILEQDRKLSWAALCQAIGNKQAWERFWAVRHWVLAMRAIFAKPPSPEEAALRAECLAWLVKQIRRHGLDPDTVLAECGGEAA
jgi:hypothetical protein